MTVDCSNDISYACTSTMNVATIEVGHQGQLKHISLLKSSSLYPKTNFETVLRSFKFLFYRITIILQRNMGSTGSAGSTGFGGSAFVDPQSSNTQHCHIGLKKI